MNFTFSPRVYMNSQQSALTLGISGANAKTITGWARSGTADSERALTTIGNVSAIGGQFGIFKHTATNDWILSSSPGVGIVATVPNSATTWNHFAGTYNGTTMRFYINGLFQDESIITLNTGTLATDLRFHVGTSFPTPSTTFAGDIADVRVYNRALSQEELVSMFYARGKDDIVFNLQGRWPFTDGVIGDTFGNLDTVVDLSDMRTTGGVISPDSGVLTRVETELRI